MQDVEEERRQRQRVTRRVVAAEAAHGVLEAAGERVFGDADRLTIEHEGARRERARDIDDFGHAAR